MFLKNFQYLSFVYKRLILVVRVQQLQLEYITSKFKY